MTSPLNSSTSRKTVVYWFLCFAIFGQIMELIFADGEPWIPVHFVIPDGCLNGYNLQGPTGISVLLLQSTGTAFAKGLSFDGRVLTGHVTRIGEYRLVRRDGLPSSDECSLTFHAVQDECVSNPCQNGGTCHDGFETYTCTCARGWTGTNCQTDINECASSPCQNDGICRNGQNMYMCSCVAGWIGTNCETDINECTSNPCQNNASCINGQNSYTCLCESGWTGRRCETDINECVSNPCQNNASCIDGHNSYTCLCERGWTGRRCETDNNECASNPCQNNAICIDGQNSYTCLCESGWIGSVCQTDINECLSNPCQNNASCIDGQNSYTCLCKSGWTGRICETDTLRLSTLDSKRVDVLVLKIGIPVGVTSLCVFVGFAVYIVMRKMSTASSVHERAGANDHPNPMENAEYMEMEENELYAEIEPIEHEYALVDDVIIRPQTSNESNSYLTAVSEHCTPREYCASDCQTKKEPGSPRELASSHMDTDTYESLQQSQSSVEDEYDMLGNIDIVDNGSLVMTSDERPESNCYLTPSNQAEGSYNEEDDYLKPEPSTTCRLFKSGRK